MNNASFPKQAAGGSSIRVFSDGGTRYERKDFLVESVPIDPVAVESAEKGMDCSSRWFIVARSGNSLFIMGLGGGFQYEAVSSGTFEIVDADGQGDWD